MKRAEGSRLTFVREDGSRGGNSMWVCRCDCGTVVKVRAARVRSGFTKSCGCLAAELTAVRSTTHGHSQPRSGEYDVWCSMRARCYDPNNRRYSSYGARGITVCDRWRDSFENFLADMGPRPSGKPRQISIERLHNDRGYEPDNCVWCSNPTTQARNRRSVVLNPVAVDLIRYMRRRGERPIDIAHAFGVSPQLVHQTITRKIWDHV